MTFLAASERFTAEMTERSGKKIIKTFAAYKDTPDSWVEGQPKKTNDWYAGKQYELNLVNLIKQLRKDSAAPNAKFVLATGCGNPGRTGLGLQIARRSSRWRMRRSILNLSATCGALTRVTSGARQLFRPIRSRTTTIITTRKLTWKSALVSAGR